MMDIVERLRMPTQEFHRLHTDAADEIEKLRKQLYETKDELESCIADLDREVRVGNDLMEETKQLRQQLATVTAERDELKWALIYVKQSVFEDSAAFDIARSALTKLGAGGKEMK